MPRSRSSEFAARTKAQAFADSGGRCAECCVKLGPTTGVEYDHITPVCEGGNGGVGNCRPLCRNCHGAKSGKETARCARSDRKGRKHIGAGPKRRKLLSKFKRKVCGTVVLRETGEPV